MAKTRFQRMRFTTDSYSEMTTSDTCISVEKIFHEERDIPFESGFFSLSHIFFPEIFYFRAKKSHFLVNR